MRTGAATGSAMVPSASAVPPAASSLSIMPSGLGEAAAFDLRPWRAGAGATPRAAKTSSGEAANSLLLAAFGLRAMCNPCGSGPS